MSIYLKKKKNIHDDLPRVMQTKWGVVSASFLCNPT